MSVLLCDPDQRGLLAAFTSSMERGTPVAVLDPTWPPTLRASAVAAVERALHDGRLSPGRAAVFTSGSSGAPRAVLRTHASWQASVEPLGALSGVGPGDTVWTPGPLWSTLSLYAAWHAGLVGAGVLVGTDDPRQATIVHCVPAQLPLLLRLGRDGALPRLRTVVLAGDRVGADAVRECAVRGWRLHEYYGAAELSFVGWASDGDGLQPFPGAEVEIRADVLWARSPYLALGYLDDAGPGALRTGPHGWATVGDHARTSLAGFTVLGRSTGAITTGGHTVLAHDVESTLLTVPGVEEVVVVGYPDPRLGAVVTALLVGTPERGLVREAVATLPAAARPRRWAVLSTGALPRTSAGTADRGAAQARVADGSIRTGALR